MLKKILTPKQQSITKKYKNIEKHMRIAKATTGSEKLGHLLKAEKLLNKYEKQNETKTN